MKTKKTITKRYECLVRNKFLTTEAKNIADFIGFYEAQLAMLKLWKVKNVQLDPESGISDDYAEFFTTDANIAEELGFTESE